MKAAYNSIGQMISEKWFDKDDNKTAHYKYVYDGQGNIVRSIDIGAGKEYNYLYEDGRIMQSSESDITLDENCFVTSKEFAVTTRYYYKDDELIKKTLRYADGTEQTVNYEKAENDSQIVKFAAGGKTVISHSKTDSFGRKMFDELQLGTGFVTRQFTYHAGEVTEQHKDSAKLKSSPTTQLVSQIVLSDGTTLSYNYDAEERITSVTESRTVDDVTVTSTTLYTYDALGQLLTETKDGQLVNSMTYDNYGNILTKNGVEYTYGDENWKDLLTGYGEQTITYDAQGNPVGYLGHTLTWEKGRQLKSFDGISYTYDANGIRTSKTVDGIRHDYVLDGAKILKETWGENALVPLYDNEETVCGIIYNNIPYYFLKNQQGDIISITDKNGETVARYSYDAWGVCTITQDSSDCSIATINPFRYRGYYYDTEIGMYYLQSRYYDATVGRFVNADIVELLLISNNILNNNLYSYCENESITKIDYSGHNSISLRREADSAVTFLALLIIVIKACGAVGSSNSWNPLGWVLLAVTVVALAVFGIWALANYISNKTLKASLSLINYASTAATPPPPNKGGKGTKVTSKTLYNKKGKRIDVENPGNRQGQIHLQQGKSKYYYNVKDQAFHVGSSSGELAPKSVQTLLTDKDVINAIAKGLKILGY